MQAAGRAVKAHKSDADVRWHTVCLLFRMCNSEAYNAEVGLSCRRVVAQRSASEAISADLLAVLINEETLADSVPAGYDARPGMIADVLADMASLVDKEVRSPPVSHLKCVMRVSTAQAVGIDHVDK